MIFHLTTASPVQTCVPFKVLFKVHIAKTGCSFHFSSATSCNTKLKWSTLGPLNFVIFLNSKTNPWESIDCFHSQFGFHWLNSSMGSRRCLHITSFIQWTDQSPKYLKSQKSSKASHSRSGNSKYLVLCFIDYLHYQTMAFSCCSTN